jgi:hypothetical protein
VSPAWPVAGHFSYKGWEVNSLAQSAVQSIRVSRQQKNLMRSQLEDILQVQQQIENQIEAYQQQTEYPEYNRFWNEIKQRNQENIQVVARYMVMKCNR